MTNRRTGVAVTTNAELRRLMRAAEHCGWRIEARRKGVFLRSPDGLVTLGVHAHGRSRDLAAQRLREGLRRHGVTFEP